MSLQGSDSPARQASVWSKNLLFTSILLAMLFLNTSKTEAQFFDTVKALFASLKASSSQQAQNMVENATVQTIDLLGSENLPTTKSSSRFLDRVLDNKASAFAVEEGLNRNSLDQAIADESMHALDDVAVYTVAEGDTLASIASYFEVTPDTIVTFNNLSDNSVEVGMTLEIPHISGIMYTVKKGDTLASISKLFKVMEDDIALYNGLVFGADPTEGDEVFLPGAALPKLEPKKENKKETTNKIDASKLAKDVKTAKKTIVDTVKKLTTGSDVSAIVKIKKNSGKFGSLPQYDGYYINPAPGAHRSQKLHGANGADLAAPIGTDIIASAPGTVTVARATGWNYGYGQYIVISHPNGTQTVYAHLSNINVSVGQEVARGQKIGDMGSTGNSTGPHVHFEIRGAYNPFAW